MHGTIAMQINRKGRKRKSGRRTSTGALARQPAVNYLDMASLNPERRVLPVHLRGSERATSILGRLNLAGHLTDEQFEAGRRYERVVSAYCAMCNAPRLAQMKPLFRSGESLDEVLASPATTVAEDDEERTHRRYFDAYEAIGEAFSPIEANKVHKAVNRVVMQDFGLYPDQIEPLKLGLSVLANHFGLTNHRK